MTGKIVISRVVVVIFGWQILITLNHNNNKISITVINPFSLCTKYKGIVSEIWGKPPAMLKEETRRQFFCQTSDKNDGTC